MNHASGTVTALDPEPIQFRDGSRRIVAFLAGRWRPAIGMSQLSRIMLLSCYQQAFASRTDRHRGVDVLPPGDSLSDTTLNLWAHEVAPAVREAIAKR